MLHEIIPGDDHNLAITGIVTVGMQLFFFAIAWFAQFDKVTDLAGSSNFILIALLTLLAGGGGTLFTRAIIITALVCASRLELAFYLLYRVVKRGSDSRFDEMRSKFLSFLGFWIFQMLWAWVVSLTVTFVNSDASDPELCSADWAGIAMFAVGFALQVTADFQKDAFRSDAANKGAVCSAGVWSWSRHPNFFGEMMMWWAIFLIATPVLYASESRWGWVTVLSPVFTMVILLFLSGMPTAEGDSQKRFLKTAESRDKFLAYRQQTSPLIPLPPPLYRPLPLCLKRVLFFEWKMYETDWGVPERQEHIIAPGGHHV
mmetsp:Transcript_1197/g.2645  ORF Transcript_1197/g.2645 Transcript_1197/m.2645 type:complete len:316 (-) Transcript_1197:360-1307(-)|eukprot:CAMPEP_0114558638 /NCGR_PEP_ID=MMETSP0114-20121206/10491_1 /TAXON_ID=31324 /ORGANISM="Goniomonas sp, Strain m" /LENGTH=315 /DNA_ID=CAMNT_0001744047 /DNA_START=37 /DNA_END=984 /DNA_ORIENTATION=-